ncbi:unnamed protein product [Prorocentrum cordatum]|uniref:Uncharacterized protein n=1 Tax=Prorocentrum cordatum TaxID=2364126 RepID=A0ABN9SHU7_9DINO|nr:unnamed protein product [Polarella glacialis]
MMINEMPRLNDKDFGENVWQAINMTLRPPRADKHGVLKMVGTRAIVAYAEVPDRIQCCAPLVMISWRFRIRAKIPNVEKTLQLQYTKNTAVAPDGNACVVSSMHSDHGAGTM